jgi:hypothetical protein
MGATYPSRPARSSSDPRPLHAVCCSIVGRRPVLRSRPALPATHAGLHGSQGPFRDGALHPHPPLHAAGLEARARNRPGSAFHQLRLEGDSARSQTDERATRIASPDISLWPPAGVEGSKRARSREADLRCGREEGGGRKSFPPPANSLKSLQVPVKHVEWGSAVRCDAVEP